MGNRRIRAFISGRVQGVCFRAFTAEEAQRLGLKGRVRNLADGRVEVLAEGPGDKVEALKAFCWKGPPYADVHSVEVIEEDAKGDELPPFRISC